MIDVVGKCSFVHWSLNLWGGMQTKIGNCRRHMRRSRLLGCPNVQERGQSKRWLDFTSCCSFFCCFPCSPGLFSLISIPVCCHFFSASSLSYFLMLPSDIWLKAYFPFSLFSFGKQGTGTFFKEPVTAMRWLFYWNFSLFPFVVVKLSLY